MQANKFLRKIMSCLMVFCFLLILTYISYSNINIKDIIDNNTPLSSELTVIKPQKNDKKIIPDKYNTGSVAPESSYTFVESSGIYNNISFSSRNNNKLALDFFYSNKTISGDVIFENYDFTNFTIMMINEGSIKERNINLIFNNCKLGGFSSSKTDGPISYIFNNCDIVSFNGSNATFNYCHFGGSYSDALNVYRNVTVNNCYISDMSVSTPDGTFAHTDGVQIYGAKDSLVTNINFNNCRFEIPQLSCATSSCYINACLMVQLEFCNADGIHFNDCYINGGGYSIYAWDKNFGLTLNDVTFKNINVGCVRRYGQIYPKISNGVEIDYETVKDTDKLYASTVTRDKTKKETSIIISNDTNTDKNFRIYTSSGSIYDFSIEKCPKSNEVGEMTFEDFPFDRKYTIPEFCEWIVCFEVNNDENNKEILSQIRYMNWGTETVSLNLNNVSVTNASPILMKPQDITSINSSTLLEGTCGKNVTFKLYKTGELVLKGSGSTYNYNSQNYAPWYNLSSKITSIIVDEGITGIGSLCFKGIKNLESIYLPEGITTIGNNCFINCSNLSTVSLPSTVTKIGSYAFWGTSLSKVDYSGTNDQKKEIIILPKNPSILTDKLTYSTPQITKNGQCGKDINWSYYNDGTLFLDGTGATYQFNSTNPVPWSDFRDEIVSVKISDGITNLGSQIFAKCHGITTVELPSTLATLGSNAFMCCSRLTNISLPNSITTIGNYAFHDSGLKETSYIGTTQEWENITIGSNNDPLINSSITFSK